MAEACKLLIKNCIICWNYLYLSQKLEEIKDTASREAFLDAVAMARRLPGSTSTCSASMTSRTRSFRFGATLSPLIVVPGYQNVLRKSIFDQVGSNRVRRLGPPWSRDLGSRVT